MKILCVDNIDYSSSSFNGRVPYKLPLTIGKLYENIMELDIDFWMVSDDLGRDIYISKWHKNFIDIRENRKLKLDKINGSIV